MLRIYMDSGACDVFNLDEVSGDEFENKVFLENIVLGCGKHQLYMYERSVVMGPIPFWKIILLKLNLLRVRGISETYGRTVHRMGAIESPLTFYVSDDICIAKVCFACVNSKDRLIMVRIYENKIFTGLFKNAICIHMFHRCSICPA
uniref:Bm4493 n=1 Tax=Brugia malayi TaxID=6279 RepID=A0A0J9Y888_BRUMA|nr:Bm4493 [Brugia malayi]